MQKFRISSFSDPNFLKLGMILICLGVAVYGASLLLGFPAIIAMRVIGLGLVVGLAHFMAVKLKGNAEKGE